MRNCLLSDAEQMLTETSLSIHEIAERLGFSNPSHFLFCSKNMLACHRCSSGEHRQRNDKPNFRCSLILFRFRKANLLKNHPKQKDRKQ